MRLKTCVECRLISAILSIENKESKKGSHFFLPQKYLLTSLPTEVFVPKYSHK